MKSSCLMPAFPSGVWAARLQESGLRDSVMRQSPMEFAAKCWQCMSVVCAREEQGKPTGCEYSLLSTRDLWLLLCAHLHREMCVTLMSVLWE